MEPSNNPTFDEASSEHSSNATPSEGIFRLRHGLNVNCLLKVFDYLELDGLTELCEMDPYFKELITKWTIKRKMIKLPGLYLTYNPEDDLLVFKKADHPKLIELFESFGKSMAKFTIRCAGLSHLLELIMEYCEPDTLTEIELYVENPFHFSVNDKAILPVDQQLLDQSIPFFSNLRKLLFCAADGTTDESDQKMYRNFFATILSSATKLENLFVVCVDITGGWLKNSKNLRELRIGGISCEGHKFEDLVSCLKNNSKLKVFNINYYYNDLSTIGDVISESCPKLEHFSERHFHSPYDQFHSIINRYNFLSTMPNLKKVALTSYTLCGSDLYYTLKGLAKSNIVKLKIYVCDRGVLKLDKDVTSDIIRRWLPDFTNIQTLTIDAYRTDAGFEFILHLTKYLKNLKNVTFRIYNPIADIHKVLEFAPSIQTLDLSKYHSLDYDETIKNIVETLRRIRQLDGDHRHLLHLKLDINYKYYVKELYADTGDVMSVSYFGTYHRKTKDQLDEIDQMYN